MAVKKGWFLTTIIDPTAVTAHIAIDKIIVNPVDAKKRHGKVINLGSVFAIGWIIYRGTCSCKLFGVRDASKQLYCLRALSAP